MDDFEKELRIKRLLIIVASVVTVVLVLVCVMLAMSRGKNPASQPTNPAVTTSPTGTPAPQPSVDAGESVKELLLQDVSEKGDRIVVTTTYCTVSYPVAFEELIEVEVRTQEDCAQITFYSTIDGKRTALYELLFNSREGVPLGYLQVEEDVYTVYARFYEPEGLSKDGVSTFYAVQETFNDVAMSLEDNAGFLTE